MFSRRSFPTVALLASLFATIPARTEPAPVLQKIADIRESSSVEALKFAPDGKSIVLTTQASNAIHEWTWQPQPKIIRTIPIPNVQEVHPYTGSDPILIYSPEGSRLALLHSISGIRNQPSAIYVWKARSGELLGSVGEPDNFPTMYGLAYSAKGLDILSFYHPLADSPEHLLVAYRSETQALEWRSSLGTVIPQCLVSSPTGQWAGIAGIVRQAEGTNYQPVVIFNLKTRTTLRTIEAFPKRSFPSQIAWNPDETRIAAGATFDAGYPNEPSVKIFAVPSGAQVASANPPQQNVADIAFAGGGKYLIVSTTGSLNVVTVWDSSLKSILQTFSLQNGPGSKIAVSLDGRILGIAQNDLLSIWEVK